MQRTHAFHLTVVLLLVTLTPLPGQTSPPSRPKRPKLAADRDTNSAASYFYYGGSVIDRSPDLAADAFYWASRLDPGWADPWYGRYVALLLGLPQRMLTSYLDREPKTLRDPEVLAIDSLASVAEGRNPFVDRRFDATLVETWLHRETDGAVSTFDLNRSDPALGGWLAYGRGDFHEALRLYALARPKYGKYAWFHRDRALPFVSLGLTDSALAEMQIALATLQKQEPDGNLHMYESHPLIEYSVGVLFERNNHLDSARAAYEHTLLDDIRFSPAHRSLGFLQLAAGDTAGAIAEYAQAAQLAPDDAVTWYQLGLLWIMEGRSDSAVAALETAAKAEPYYLAPHYPLGLLYERSGFLEEAAEHYRTYLRLAPQPLKDQAAVVRQRLEALHVAPKAP